MPTNWVLTPSASPGVPPTLRPRVSEDADSGSATGVRFAALGAMTSSLETALAGCKLMVVRLC